MAPLRHPHGDCNAWPIDTAADGAQPYRVRVGVWSAVLGMLAIEIAVLAIVLARAGGNRLANRMIAGALAIIAGLMVPFVIGYAGAYDEWPWLSFAPFAVPLALGPLLYGHLTAIVRGTALRRRHWIAPVTQFVWQACVFPWPPTIKNRFDALVAAPYIGPLEEVALFVSTIGYGIASWRLARRYEADLRQRRRQVTPARRLRLLLATIAALMAAQTGYSLFEVLVRPINYFDLFGYYLMLGVLGTALGIDGWRSAGSPALPVAPIADPAERWLEAIDARELWRDPTLTPASLARQLGTNRAYLSQALAPHGGFTRVIGNARARAVARWLDERRGGDLLALALQAGFGSKASFNRAFQRTFGMSPSAYRASHGQTAAMLPD